MVLDLVAPFYICSRSDTSRNLGSFPLDWELPTVIHAFVISSFISAWGYPWRTFRTCSWHSMQLLRRLSRIQSSPGDFLLEAGLPPDLFSDSVYLMGLLANCFSQLIFGLLSSDSWDQAYSFSISLGLLAPLSPSPVCFDDLYHWMGFNFSVPLVCHCC